MIQDPVCGTLLSQEHTTQVTSEYEGQTYYFCSEQCQSAFEANPERYTRQRQH